MSDCYIGELRIFSFGITPRGWMPCQGQIVAIGSNQALFSILGTTFGGDGRNTFALPDLRGRVPVFNGGSVPTLGESGGEAEQPLVASEMPLHNHSMKTGKTAGAIAPGGNFLAPGATNFYASGAPDSLMNPGVVANVGGQPHDNMAPYLTLNICIATTGFYPSRS